MTEFWSQLALDRIGFGLATAGYLFFFALLLTVKARNVPRSLLLAFSLATACWALSYATLAIVPYQSLVSIWLENTRLLLMMLFLYAALHISQNSLTSFFSRTAVWLSCLLMLSWSLTAHYELLSLNSLVSGQLLLSIFILALLEALYRKAGDERWQFKPLIFALSICVLFDFVLLAEATLFQRIDDQLWATRGYVNVLMIPLLVISVRRIKAWNIRVYISRDIVLQSSLVLGTGAYLCLLALAGFYIRFSGGAWSQLLQAVFVVLGFAILAVLVLSENIRRRLKVFIEKHFFENTFDYRVKWLELTHRLRQIDFNKDNVHQQCLNTWLQAIGYTRGVLIRVQQKQINVLALSNRQELTQHEMAILEHYMTKFPDSNWMIDLQQPNDPFVQSLSFPVKSINTQLIIPIRSKEGLWGLCLMNAESNLQLKLNWELRDYLIAVTEQVASYLFLLEASHKLMENAQFAAFNRMSAFVVHDLKNIKAQIDLLLKNAEKHRDNPEFIADAFDTMAATQQRMQKMLAQLMNKDRTEDKGSRINVATAIQQLLNERCKGQLPLPTLYVEHDLMLSLDKERFCNVLFHLIDNAQYATPADGEVKLHLSHNDNAMILKIQDTGCGMSQDFIEHRLYKPFDSTKGNAGMGIGAYDALLFAQQLGGQLQVESQTGVGTTFTMQLPLN
ncbi:MAG: PEP-CTERM system histidine kinase PrsK [Alkalimonas sp.]|nr:PEP-CTERM system histidine kinase PrsK [Alkalimonas sp.]